MKKFSITLLLGLACLVFVMNGCKKVNCTELTEDYTNAYMEYITNPSDANCEAFADALKQLVDKCTVANKADLEDMLDDLNCGK
jgi:hypothetical protein